MDPYRTPSPPVEEKPASLPEGEPDLGAARSTHHLSGATALVANAVGKTTTLVVHDNGFHIIEDGIGQASKRAVPFDAIHFLYYDFDKPLTASPGITIVTADGFRWRLPHELEERELVLAALRRKVTKPLIESAMELFAEGERLTFGPLAVSPDGVHLDDVGALAWGDLGHVVAERQALLFYRREPLGRFGWVGFGQVPNPAVLLHLLETRTRLTFDGVSV